MTVIGDAFVALRPETSGFAAETEGKLNGIFGGLAGPLGALAGTALGVAGAVGAIGLAFEKSNETIQRTTGASGAVLTGLEGTVKTVFASVPSSLGNVTSALDEVFVRTGLTGTALAALTKQEVDLAKITGTDVASTVDSTTALLNKFGVSAQQRAADLDVLFKGTQASGKGLDTLTADLKKTAPALGALNLTFQQQVALVSELEASGARVQSVVTGIGKVFSLAAKQGQDPIVVFNTIIKQLQTAKTAAEATTIAVKDFGVRAGPELATAVRQGNFDVTKLFAQITNGKGGIEATTTATLSLGDKFKILKNTAEVSLAPVGAKLVDWATNQIPHVANALKDITFAFTVGGNVWEQAIKGHGINTTNLWTTAISETASGVLGLQRGFDGLTVPKNAPLIEKFFNDIGLFFTNELPIDLAAAADTWDHWVERFHSGATRVADDLKTPFNALHALGAGSGFPGVKAGVPNVTQAGLQARANAVEAALGRGPGSFRNSNFIGPQLTKGDIAQHLGPGSPMLTTQQQIAAYLKSINDWIHNNGASPFAGSTQTAQRHAAAGVGGGLAVKLSRL